MEPFEFQSTTELVAHKAHTCALCQTAIDVGVKHERTFGVFDGYSSTYRHHYACSRFARDCLNAFGWDAWSCDGVEQQLYDEADWIGRDALRAALPESVSALPDAFRVRVLNICQDETP